MKLSDYFRIVWAFGWIPILVIKSAPPGEFRGYTRLFTLLIIPITWIQIHPNFWDDEHILVHELQHVEDYLWFPWVYWFRYNTPEGRLRLESRAYARQYLSYEKATRARFDHFVWLIMKRYEFEYALDMVVTTLQLEIDSLRVRRS